MNAILQFLPIVGQAAFVDVRLEVIVQILVGVQLRGTSRQQEHVDPLAALIDPIPHFRAVMSAEAIDDDVDLPLRLRQEALQEQDEHRRVQRPFVGHEMAVPFVAHRRDHIAADVPVGDVHRGALSLTGIAAARTMVGLDAALVGPDDRRIFLGSQSFDLGVGLL